MAKFFKFFKVTIFLSIVIFSLIQLNNIFMRKAIYKPWDMANKIGGYYNSKDDYSLYFLGTSHSYCSFNPLLIYENTGLKSYVLGTEKQPLDITYYYLKDVIKKDIPGTVFIDVLSIITLIDEDEQVVHSYSNYMPMSLNKIAMIAKSVPYGLKAQALFPLIKYHSRWNELKDTDFSLKYSDYTDYLRGYVLLKGQSENFKNNIDTVMNNEDAKSAIKKENFENNLKTVKKIVDYANSKDVKVIFVKTPIYFYKNYEYTINKFNDFTKRENINFIDSKELKEDEEIVLFIIANSASVGGFRNLAPMAEVFDGYLDVLMVKAGIGILDLPELIRALLNGKHVDHNKVIYIKTKEIKIESDKDVVIDIDGERAGKLPMTFKVLEKALRIVVN